MNNTNEKTASVLKSLITINNDRYEGYKTAAEEAQDADLKTVFNKFSSQSQQFGNELRGMLSGDAPAQDETTTTGKLYRVWMDMKAAITSHDRHGILASCEFGEDVALKSYKSALEETELTPEARASVQKHTTELQMAHDSVKAMRDSAK